MIATAEKLEEPAPTPAAKVDRGERSIPPALCCARIGNGSWCVLTDAHEGEHSGPAPLYGPVEPYGRGSRCKALR